MGAEGIGEAIGSLIVGLAVTSAAGIGGLVGGGVALAMGAGGSDVALAAAGGAATAVVGGAGLLAALDFAGNRANERRMEHYRVETELRRRTQYREALTQPWDGPGLVLVPADEIGVDVEAMRLARAQDASAKRQARAAAPQIKKRSS